MALYTCEVGLLQKDGSIKTVCSSEILPGDIIEVPQGKVLPCDLIFLTGSAIINEAMLTGESIPLMKNGIPIASDEKYNEKESAKFTLYGGTTVI